MKVEVDYYINNEDKKMGDGTVIPKDQKLILIKEEDDLLQLEASEDGSTIFFWSKKEEVTFLERVEEDWSEEKINERNCYINGEFL